MSRSAPPSRLVQQFIRTSPAPISFKRNERSICLDLNETSGLIPQNLAKEMGFADAKALSKYPQYDTLHKAIAHYAKVPKERIQVVNGSDEAIPKLIRSFFKKGDVVVIPSPTFFSYPRMLRLEGIRSLPIAHVEDSGTLKLPVKKILTALKKKNIRGIILCNPANPTGDILSEIEMRMIIKETARLGIVCIVDEAYFEFYGKSVAPFISRYPHVVVLRTFSKIFGFAGLRIGYVIAHRDIIAELKKLILPWEVNHPGVRATLTALKHVRHFRAQQKLTIRRRTKLSSLFQSYGVEVFHTYTNFLICRIPQREKFIAHLKKQGVLVRPISLPGCVRISVPGKDTQAEVLKSIRVYFNVPAKKQ